MTPLLLAQTTTMLHISQKLSEKYKIISEYMRDNRLKLNDEKTHLLVMGTDQPRSSSQATRCVEIRTPSENIRPSQNEKLLACWVSDNLKWSVHLRDSKESLTSAFSSRMGCY